MGVIKKVSQNDQILDKEVLKKKHIDGINLAILIQAKLAVDARLKTKDMGHSLDHIISEMGKANNGFYSGFCNEKMFVFHSNHHLSPNYKKPEDGQEHGHVVVFNRSNFVDFYGPLVTHNVNWIYSTSNEVYVNTDSHVCLLSILNNILLVEQILSARKKKKIHDIADFEDRVINKLHHIAKTNATQMIVDRE
ncbi:hypothetical protein AKO1_014465, partial [Acrasis kona]